MISLQKLDKSVRFTFTDNGHYLENGSIDAPLNSLAMVIDESDIVTFYKADSQDIFISGHIDEFGKSKSDLMDWYKSNMVGIITDENKVQGMINNSLTNYTTTAQTKEAIEAVDSDIDKIRENFDNYNPTDNFKTINNQSIIGKGNIVIEGGSGGGADVTIDSELNSGSTNAVANSAITEAVMVNEYDRYTNYGQSFSVDKTSPVYPEKFYFEQLHEQSIHTINITNSSRQTLGNYSLNFTTGEATFNNGQVGLFTIEFKDNKFYFTVNEASTVAYINVLSGSINIYVYNNTIGGDNAANVIYDDIFPSLTDIEAKANGSLTGVSIQISTMNGNPALMAVQYSNNNKVTTTIYRGFNLDDFKVTSNSKLALKLNVGLGTYGYTEESASNNCQLILSNDKPEKIRITFDTTSNRRYEIPWLFASTNDSESSGSFSVNYSSKNDTVSLLNLPVDSITYTYNSGVLELTLPTGESTYRGETGVFSFSNISSTYCDFNNGTSKVETYGEETMDIREYVKTLEERIKALENK